MNPAKPKFDQNSKDKDLYRPYEAQDPIDDNVDYDQIPSVQPPADESEISIVKSFVPISNGTSEPVAKITDKTHPYVKQLITENQVYKNHPLTAEKERKILPCKRDPEAKINFLSLLKDCIGKDLSRIAMPVYINEPISMLQKKAQFLEFAKYLRMANNAENKVMRLAYIMCFFYAMLPASALTSRKPFNPLLGETYEFVQDDLFFLAEQVSHHPPISAFYCESKDFVFEGYWNTKTSISLSGFVVTPNGPTKVTLKNTKETFVLKRQKTSVHNLMIGKTYVWHYGDCFVTNEKTKEYALLNFKAKGWTSANDYECDGGVYDSDKKQLAIFSGKWNEFLNLSIDGIQVEAFRAAPLPPDAKHYYFFSEFSMNLNHISPDLIESLPPTDSRLRPDQRAYEFGDIDLATAEKKRLEEKQRGVRKQMEKAKQEWKPLWFHQLSSKGGEVNFQFNGKYLPMRENKMWPKNIFDLYN